MLNRSCEFFVHRLDSVDLNYPLNSLLQKPHEYSIEIRVERCRSNYWRAYKVSYLPLFFTRSRINSA